MVGVEHLFDIASSTGQILLLVLILARRFDRVFPAFTAFMLWQIVSDALFYLAAYPFHEYFGQRYSELYYVLEGLAYVLELCVLLEIAANVLHPSSGKSKLSSRRIFFGSLLCIGVLSFLVIGYVRPVPFEHLRMFYAINTTATVLCVALFVVIVGFSQVLGLNWRNHVLQLATGLAFFSIVDLAVQFIHNQLRPGPQYSYYYQLWSRVDVAGYVCTLYFWCWAFAKKEAPRRDFSPQMAKFLASLSRSAKRQNAVLARSHDE